MKRKISTKEIINLYDKFEERLNVISFSKTFNHERIMELKNVNIFEAFKELSIRVTPETYCIIALDLPNDIDTNDYKEVKKFQLKIDDYWFGKPLKNNKNMNDK
jgi:hypothetical protein